MAYQHAKVRTTAELSDVTDPGSQCTYTRRVSASFCVPGDCYLGVGSAQWGFHPGGWGKPPLDEYNRPLYGDVFGVLPRASDTNVRSLYVLFLICFDVLCRWVNRWIGTYGASWSPKKVCLVLDIYMTLIH